MRVSRDKAGENRAAVVAAAGELLRLHGVDGVGVDALTRAAGLSHGGFYKSFASKDALVAEACARVLAEQTEAWRAPGATTLEEFVESYLSPEHCTARGRGCVFAALAVDAGRREGALRGVFTRGLEAAAGRLTRLMPGVAARRRERALATMAALVGAIVLARASDDDALRDDILAATAAMVLRRK